MKSGVGLLILGLLGTVAQAAPRSEIHWVMGTYLRVTVTDADASPAMRGCFADARRLDHIFSRFDTSSELSRLHQVRTQAASGDFRALLDRSLRLRRRTGGAFDVTIGALTTLWRANGSPAPTEIAAARASLGGVTRTGEEVRLAPDTQLDFDGIAKGYAVDACVARLRAGRVRRAFVSFGESSLYAFAAWDVALRGIDSELAIGTLRLRDQALSVSATRRPSGRRGTIVDPASGRILREDRVAIVVAPSATDAEAYSKALLLWGSAGLARLEAIPGVRTALVSARGIEMGAAMQRAGILTIWPTPRPLGRAEDGLS